MKAPLLYSFRRCPYAIRARLALHYAGVAVDKCEVSLRDKPAQLLRISPKGTVPVLQLPDGSVLEESLDIARWALQQADPHKLLRRGAAQTQGAALIEANDGEFKHWLDRYKYADRHPEAPPEHYRAQGEHTLATLESRLASHRYLCDDRPSLADIAIAPFVRQFAHVDRDWFAATPYLNLQAWLEHWLTSEAFETVMRKPPKPPQP